MIRGTGDNGGRDFCRYPGHWHWQVQQHYTHKKREEERMNIKGSLQRGEWLSLEPIDFTSLPPFFPPPLSFLPPIAGSGAITEAEGKSLVLIIHIEERERDLTIPLLSSSPLHILSSFPFLPCYSYPLPSFFPFPPCSSPLDFTSSTHLKSIPPPLYSPLSHLWPDPMKEKEGETQDWAGSHGDRWCWSACVIVCVFAVVTLTLM